MLGRRLMSTYPFASNTRTSTAPASSTMAAINEHAVSLNASSSLFTSMFSRRAKTKIRPGSILSVTSYNSMPSAKDPNPSTQTFSGVLIGVRRRNSHLDTSIRLRNVVGRVGVETSYKVMSPLIKEIKVVQEATKSGPPIKPGSNERRPPALPALRRAKGYYLRDDPERLPNVTAFLKQARQRELQEQEMKAAPKRQR